MPFSFFRRSWCNVKGSPIDCLDFELKGVEYNPPDCLLGNNPGEITFSIEGLKPDVDVEHECELEVIELGKGGRVLFSPDLPRPAWSKGSQLVFPYILPCNNKATIKFFVKKVNPPPPGPLEVPIKCIFRHRLINQNVPLCSHFASIQLKRP